ncbi:MAG: serine/threonine-protein kinase [Sciscionella sp.]
MPVGGVVGLIGTLLAALHRGLPTPLCHGDWLLTTSLAGAVLALLPVIGALLVAFIRKVIGNRYGLASGTLLGLTGVAFCLVLPWLAFRGVTEVYSRLSVGASLNGIPSGALSTRSCFVGDQASYLTQSPTVRAAVFGSGSRLAHGFYLALLVALPLVGLLFVWLQAKAATRKGPAWPRRLLWVPYLLFAMASAPFEANVVAQLWLGFVPASLLGALLVWLVGPPRWSVVNRSRQPRYEPEPEYEPEYQPEPVADARELADTPGPMPFPAAGSGTAVLADTVGNGRFRRVRTLGKGGFGTVWLAVDTQLDRTVAVKFAHAPDTDTEARILREARALAAVRHPNCVRIYDIVATGHGSDGLGIVMEYIEGRALSDTVRSSNGLDEVAAARLWATMAGALQAAHDRAVLHRDIKPSNVIVDPAGSPHLIDFGIARNKGDMTLTAAGMMVGTPDFLAPETAAGQPATPASDAWQLAATVSYSLTGQPPRGHRENSMAALMAAANAEPCTELPRGGPHVRMLRAALDSNPSRRPTLAIVHRELGGWLAGTGHSEEGPLTRVLPPSEPLTRPNGA